MGRHKIDLDKKIVKLQQDVYNLRHYWQIRCAQRGTLVAAMQRATEVSQRLERQEKLWARLLHRDKLSISHSRVSPRRGGKLYPVYMSANDINKMRQSFKRGKNRCIVLLPLKDIHKLHKMLRTLK